MLVQTQTEMPFISVMKLPGGEEFICKVVDKTITGYKVNKPLILVNTPNGIQFAPALMMAAYDADVTVPNNCLMAKPSPEFEAQYTSAVSGIAVPPAGSIIGG